MSYHSGHHYAYNNYAAAANDFWQRKMAFYFNEVLDVNNDGVVNNVDLEIFRSIFKQMKHLSGDQELLNRFNNFLNTWFRAIMQADKTHGDNDGSITLQEFIAYAQQLKSQLGGRKTIPDSLNYIQDYVDALFQLLDADGDGYISKNDYVVAYSDFEDAKDREGYWARMNPGNADRAKLDKNQFIELCIEFLTSSNPNDKGNWLFGIF